MSDQSKFNGVTYSTFPALHSVPKYFELSIMIYWDVSIKLFSVGSDTFGEQLNQKVLQN